MRTLSLFLVSFLFAPVMAGAHGDGLSFERKVGNILIDIGYGTVQPSPGSTLTYSFDLFDVTNPNAPVFEPFSEVSVRLFKEREEMLNRTLTNDGTNIPSISFPFKDAGNYTFAVSYDRNGKEPVQATFGFAVVPSTATAVSSAAATSNASSSATTVSVRSFAIDPMVAAAIGGVIVLLILARIALLFRGKKRRRR